MIELFKSIRRDIFWKEIKDLIDRLDERLVYLFVEGVWKTERDWKGLK